MIHVNSKYVDNLQTFVNFVCKLEIFSVEQKLPQREHVGDNVECLHNSVTYKSRNIYRKLTILVTITTHTIHYLTI